MDYTKSKAPANTYPQDIYKLSKKVDNAFKMIMIIAKRSNQISAHLKEELNRKLQEFETVTNSLEEIFENKEQIAISVFYERLPKPTSMAMQEYKDDKIYHRIPTHEEILNQEKELNKLYDTKE